MFKNRIGVLAGILLFMGLWTCASADVLYFTDATGSGDVIAGAIALTGKTAMQATSKADFVTKLSSGTWELVILGEQSNSIWNTSGISAAVANYLSQGGKIIGATWLTQ
jgi:hypothetical protein